MSVFWERDEANWARAHMTEMDRAVACGHDWRATRYGAECVDCGETMSREDV